MTYEREAVSMHVCKGGKEGVRGEVGYRDDLALQNIGTVQPPIIGDRLLAYFVKRYWMLALRFSACFCIDFSLLKFNFSCTLLHVICSRIVRVRYACWLIINSFGHF